MLICCPDCNGRGGTAENWAGWTRTVWKKCQRCKETGRIIQPPEAPSLPEPSVVEEETIIYPF